MDEVEDDLLCDSEPELDHVTLHKGLLHKDQLQHSAKPIPIPSHKRRLVVKYEEGNKISSKTLLIATAISFSNSSKIFF